VGDRGGRVIIFQRIEENGIMDWDYLTEFQSHETSFDPLNSNQIPEKINVLEWINVYPGSASHMLSANDKLIKLWKIDLRKEKKYESAKKLLAKGKVMLPRSKVVNEGWEGRCKALYRSAHEYHINSLCLSPDGENFLSADDLRVNLWHVDDSTQVYNVIDMKPKSMEELDEIVTHCEFHPRNSSVFLYTTSKGLLHLCDFRAAASFQNQSSLRFEVGLGQKKNAFSELINSLSFAKFLPAFPNHIVSRDYLSVKLWDVRSQRMPLASIAICDYLEKNLLSLYEEDYIYDKFFLDVSPCSGYVVTGAYNRSAHVLDLAASNNLALPTNFDTKRGKLIAPPRKYGPNRKLLPVEAPEAVDFKKKVMAGCWSPKENTVALAFRNCIFLFSDKALQPGVP
jgi:serine/threonine-protein phosphatase 2A regulatory subunit B